MYHYQENIVDTNGKALNGWSIGLYAVGGDPATAPAVTIYSDRAGATAIPGGTVRSVTKGFVEFYVPSGTYSRRYYNSAGVYQYTVTDSDMTGSDVVQAIAYVTPQMFGAVGDGVTDDTAALQAMIDYCYNSGSIRANAVLWANKTYLVSDPNGDGYCLLLPDGVSLSGTSALTSKIQTTTAGKVILRRYRTGTARQGFLRDFCLDGTGVAKGCLELFGSAYDAAGGTLRCQNALRPVVIDGVQNFTLRSCVATNGDWLYSILNGAGTFELDVCHGRYGRYGHILIDNDPAYEGYQLAPAGGASPLAYAMPTAITVRGGVYEDDSTTSPGQLKASVRINTGARVLVYGNATLAIPASGSECHIDDGRFSLAAAYASTTSFTIANADVTSYFPNGRRVLLADATCGHYAMPYGQAEYLTSTTFRVSGDQTAIFTASKLVRLVKADGTWVTATVSSSAYTTITTVTVSAAVVPTTMISAQVGFIYGVVSSTSFATNTTVNLTMDAGWTVPATLSFVEAGRSDDGSTAIWYSASTGAVTGTHIRDVTISVSGTGFANSSLRSGAYQSIYDGFTFSGVQGDWFEISQSVSVIKPNGSLTGGKLRTRHVKGIFTGFASISYIANQQANAGTFEIPGHASAMAYSSSGGAWRWYDNSGVWRTVPAVSSSATGAAPSFNASHVGQVFIDSTIGTAKAYMAYRTGTGATDWIALN